MRPIHPPRPPHPAPPSGILVQKIIACEKRRLPCVNAEWRFASCTSGSIQHVQICGSPSWTLTDGCRLRITLPLSVRFCDPCGRCSWLPAGADVETDLPRTFAGALGEPRNTLLILPCVQLLRADETCGGCFRAQLAVSLEMYLLRCEVMHCAAPTPPCPQLPLYPQPMC